MSSEADPLVDEWKSSISQMDKFDGYLIDLRKYGFTFITGLATAGSFLGFQQPAHDIHIGVIIATMVLVDILFWVDQYYQNLLFGAILNARKLELRTGRHLVETISDENRLGFLSRSFQIALVYIGFLVALWVLGTISAEGAASQPQCPNQCAQQSAMPTSDDVLAKRMSFSQMQDERIVPNFSTFRFTLLDAILIISLVATVGYIVTLQKNVAQRRRQNYEKVRIKLLAIEPIMRFQKLRVQKLGEQRSDLFRRRESMRSPSLTIPSEEEKQVDKQIARTDAKLGQARENLRKELEDLDNEIRDIFDPKWREQVMQERKNREDKKRSYKQGG